MRELTSDVIWDAVRGRRDGKSFVPVVLSTPEPSIVLWNGTEIQIPADPLGILNLAFDGSFSITHLEHTLKAFDMELAGYGWLGKVAGCVYMERTEEDLRTVARLAAERLQSIVGNATLLDEYTAIARHLLATADIPEDLKARFREGHKHLTKEDL